MAFTMDAETAKIVSAGRRAWSELKKRDLWPHWVAVGRAIQAGRAAMMNYLRIDPGRNEPPSGRQWSEHFGAWLKETGFDEIDKGVRSRLEKCMDYLPEIESWREDIGPTRRQQYNHPNTVWRHFSQKHGITAARPRPAKPSAGADDPFRETQELNDNVRALLDDSKSFDLTPERIADSVENFIAVYGNAAALRFAGLLIARLKPAAAPAPEPAGWTPDRDPAFAASLNNTRSRRRSKPEATDDPSPYTKSQRAAMRAAIASARAADPDASVRTISHRLGLPAVTIEAFWEG